MRQDAIKTKPGSVAVLDIGTSKIACFIAVPDDDGKLRVEGIGHQLARGIKSGAINDVGEAETSIVAAVHAAEQMAEDTIENIIVSLNGTAVRSCNVSVELDISDEAVSDQDIMDIIHEGCASIAEDDYTIIHCFPIQYQVDDSKGVKDPRGMVGSVLLADLHIIIAKNSHLRNLSSCIARCHLNIAEYIAGSHASAMACLQPDEREMGVTLIDIGGGITNVSVFAHGKNILSDAIPIGGAHITNDIATGLSTSFSHAERLKTLHGSAMSSPKDDEVMMDVPQLGEEEDDDDPTRMPRSMLVGVVRPRVEELFELVRARIEASGVDKVSGRRCVITGGASQMLGMNDLAGRMLGKQVRIGRPRAIAGLPDSVSGPAFCSAVGMLAYTQTQSWEDEVMQNAQRAKRISFTFGKMIHWFKENF